MSVVTRFAPSPTGFLHIGGARTALFNWLFAAHHGGTMLLRIEDTDRARSTDAAVTAILDGLGWMGLDWEGEPVSQFERADRHRAVAEELIAAGRAYHAYDTAEELEAMRERARAEKRPPRYAGRWRDASPGEAPEGVDPVVRIKAPREGETLVRDEVQGDVRFPNADLDDFVILRSDGTPTYMLAVVVDDHDMGVTHVIRGDDHLTNAARQQLVYHAMGWDVPAWGHIPLIHGADGAKLSKRHGALGAEAYRAMGFLPVALRNYLARLGWSHGDDEIMATEDMVRWFDLGDVNKGAARFDIDKLTALNAHWMRHTPDDELLAALEATLPHITPPMAIHNGLDETGRARLARAIPGLKERSRTLVELADAASFLFEPRPLAPDAKAAGLIEGAREQLKGLHDQLAALEDWSAESTEQVVRSFADEQGLKLGKVAQPLRAALTGRTTSPGIFDVLVALGRDESLGRIADAAEGAAG